MGHRTKDSKEPKKIQGKDGSKESPSSDVNTNMEKNQSNADTLKRLTVEEIFAMMNAKTEQFHLLHTEIAKLAIEIEGLKNERSALQAQIKPIRRVAKKFNPNGVEFTSVSPEQRKENRHKIQVINNQVIIKEDQLSHKKSEFSAYSESIAAEMKKSALINKAQSKYWTKRNKWSIEARILKTLNKLRFNDVKQLRDLAKLASSKANNNNLTFNNALQKLLDEIDAETSILCSYSLKSEMYAAIRNTLQKWNNKIAPEFENLVFNDKQ